MGETEQGEIREEGREGGGREGEGEREGEGMYLKRLQVWSRGMRERLRKGERHAYAFRKKLY